MAMDYYYISPEKLGDEAKLPIIKLGDSGEVFYELAAEMLSEIKRNNAAGKSTVFICPVGPVGQYPIFTRLVNRENISLKNCWFINMDEYLTDEGRWIDKNNRLSFRGYMEREVYARIKADLLMPEKQRVFPGPRDLEQIPAIIDKLGGVDICFGGIGITGHLAFNEPDESLTPEQFAALPTRVLNISTETRTVNAIGDLNGAVEAMPNKCITVGMKEILGARKLRLAVFRDWHRAVCRRAAYGEVTSAFPATLAQRHPDALLYVTANAAKQPYRQSIL